MATNKLQASIGTLTASIYFIRQGAVDIKKIKWLVVPTFIGSVFGGWLVLKIDAAVLIVYLPVLLILMGLYFLFAPTVRAENRKRKITLTLFAIIICPLLGAYDGFFGPGAGSFMALSFVLLCGYRLSKATAHTKILNFTSNISALLYFIAFGDIFWLAGIVMMGGQYIGARVGAKMVLHQGESLIRPVVVAVCFLMSINIIIKATLVIVPKAGQNLMRRVV